MSSGLLLRHAASNMPCLSLILIDRLALQAPTEQSDKIDARMRWLRPSAAAQYFVKLMQLTQIA